MHAYYISTTHLFTHSLSQLLFFPLQKEENDIVTNKSSFIQPLEPNPKSNNSPNPPISSSFSTNQPTNQPTNQRDSYCLMQLAKEIIRGKANCNAEEQRLLQVSCAGSAVVLLGWWNPFWALEVLADDWFKCSHLRLWHQFRSCHDGLRHKAFQRVVALVCHDLRDAPCNNSERNADILGQGGNNGLHRDVFLISLPAIVVCGHCEDGVRDFGFFAELGFGTHCHPNDGCSPGPVELGLGTGRKLRPFHVHVRTCGLQRINKTAHAHAQLYRCQHESRPNTIK